MAASKIKSTASRNAGKKPKGEALESSKCSTNTDHCDSCSPTGDEKRIGCGPPLLSLQHCVQSISECLEDLEVVRELAKSQLQQVGIIDSRRKICSDIIVDTSRATAKLWSVLYPIK